MKRGTIILILIFLISQFGFSQSEKVVKDEKVKVEEKIQKKEIVKIEKKIKKRTEKKTDVKVIKNKSNKINELSNPSKKIGHSNENLGNEIKEQKIKEHKLKEDLIKEERIKESTINEENPKSGNTISKLGQPIQPTKVKASAQTLKKGSASKTTLKEDIYKKSQKQAKKKIEN